MAKYLLLNPVVTIDGDDHSDHFSEVEIDSEFDEVDVTGFGASYRDIRLGLGDATMTFEAFQDHAANELDQNLWPIHANRTAVEITVKPTSAAVSSTNPEYSMTGVLPKYRPIAGRIGEAGTTPVVFRNQGTAGLVRSFS